MMSTSPNLSIFQELQISLDFDILIGRLDATQSIDLIVSVLLKLREAFTDSNSSLFCRLSSPTSGNETRCGASQLST